MGHWKFPQRKPSCSPKENLPYFQGWGVVPHSTICHYYVICILMVVGALSPWAWAAVHLPVERVFVVSLLASVISFERTRGGKRARSPARCHLELGRHGRMVGLHSHQWERLYYKSLKLHSFDTLSSKGTKEEKTRRLPRSTKAGYECPDRLTPFPTAKAASIRNTPLVK